ncbi:methyl-accepting chemotaxis protein [Curvibacter sp. HBC61]|uniref:Methyl-accepting chemotaxis protein n=1 Tax=Curvibacter cyanobacteriorum TaxID=3026422 RepID=A0ABT5N085_9BURK|nr:PAS domain-containing methyl-accepting chemotaxis protein [Curvibacter sp. HBC61]MDD0839730.1 methyl-accepting chemotaxis protein [Curvibacter sp. HBC61]
MRTNLPVTQREYLFPATETLLSTTDLDSRITYANASFIRTSGFEVDELIGQPHNMVRHPDMPVEAFADMWRTLKAGQSWRGLVKNRRANGDHYWVVANASPMRRQGRVVGYLSARTQPTRQEVEATEKLYARFKAGTAGGLKFDRGLIVRGGWLGWTSAWQTLPTAWRVRLPLLAVALLSVLALSAAGLPTLVWLGLAATVVLSLLVADVVIEGNIIRPLDQILGTAQQVASGERARDLNLHRTDHIGLIARAINQAGLNLQSLVSDVLEQATSVQAASEQVARSSNDLSSRTEQSASTLEQTAAAMEQQTASVQNNSESAQEASKITAEATLVAEKSGQAMTDVESTMARISGSSKKISDIIQVIDGIAFQTNILALNAAVEAARAGDQGRGFAVVASEVRSLAGRSAAAAKEISALIADSVNTVQDGSQHVADAGQTLRDLVQQVQRVNKLVAEITAASREQARGISQVGSAVAQLDQMTQQNATMVEESSAAAHSMGAQADRLVQAVKVFSA